MAVVSLADTIVDPTAVVVEFVDTTVAAAAVLGSVLNVGVTNLTHELVGF